MKCLKRIFRRMFAKRRSSESTVSNTKCEPARSPQKPSFEEHLRSPVLNETDRNIMKYATMDPSKLHPSVALSVGIETEAMILRHRAQDLVDRFPNPDDLMDACNKLDGTAPGTNGVFDRIAKTEDEYRNKVLPSVGKTEAQIDAWNALMMNGGRVMMMGKDKPTYVEVNPREIEPKVTETIEIGSRRDAYIDAALADAQRKGVVSGTGLATVKMAAEDLWDKEQSDEKAPDVQDVQRPIDTPTDSDR